MRIEENYSKIDYPQLYRGDRNRRRPAKTIRFFLSLLFAAAIILALAILTVKLAVGPIMKQVESLPGDFPSGLDFYELSQAQIKIQNPASRKKIISLVGKFPDWLIEPIIKKISPDLRQELEKTFGGSSSGIDPGQLSAEEFKNILNRSELEKIKNLSLSWVGLEKTKEDLADYYKQQLQINGFEFKENIDDYEISLGFWKEGVFGEIDLSASGNNPSQSDVDVNINYSDK